MGAAAFTEQLRALAGPGGLAREAQALPALLGVCLLGLQHHGLPAAEALGLSALHYGIYRAEARCMGAALLACVLALALATERTFLSTMTWVYANLAMKYPDRNAAEVYAVAVLIARTFVSRVTLAGGPTLGVLELLVGWVFVLFLVHFQLIMLLITLLSVPALESVLTFNLVSFTKDSLSSNLHMKLAYIAIILFPFLFLLLLLLYLARYTKLGKESIQDVAFVLTSVYSVTLGDEWAIYVLAPLVLLESLRNMGYMKSLFAVPFLAELASCFELDSPDACDAGQNTPALQPPAEKKPLPETANPDPKTDKKQQAPHLRAPRTASQPKEKAKSQCGAFFSLGWLFEGGAEKRSFRGPAGSPSGSSEVTKLIAIFWPVFDAYIYKSNGKTREGGTGFSQHLFPLYVCGIAHPVASLVGRHFGSIRNFNGAFVEDAATFLGLTLYFSSSLGSCELNWDRVAVPLGMTAMRLTERRASSLMLPLSLVSFYYAYALSQKYAKPVFLEQPSA